MKIFVCSDVHGNLRALQAVLGAYEREKPCDFLFLGDVVGYGAHPEECIESLLKIPGARMILGNHEAALIGDGDADMNEFAAEAIRWTRRRLTEDGIASIKERFEPSVDGGYFLAVHASPANPRSWTYIFTAFEAEEAFKARGFEICFVGHTHQPAAFVCGEGEIPFREGVPLLLVKSKRYIINVGSVGQPRDGDSRAACAVFDSDRRTVTLTRLEYDVLSEARDIKKAGLPSFLADRLTMGL